MSRARIPERSDSRRRCSRKKCPCGAIPAPGRCGLKLDQIELAPGPRMSRLRIEPTILDHPEPVLNGNWDVELEAVLQPAYGAALQLAGLSVFA